MYTYIYIYIYIFECILNGQPGGGFRCLSASGFIFNMAYGRKTEDNAAKFIPAAQQA